MKNRPVRVAIVSDTHGELDPRIALRIHGCDHAVHAGDLGSRAVVRAMKPRCSKPLVVRGNNDVDRKWAPQERRYLNTLPTEACLDLPGGRLVVVHGDKAGRPKTRHQWLRNHYRDARLIVYGHSHHLCLDLDEQPWVVNPGAAGRSRTFGGPSFVILTAGVRKWRVESRRFPRMA